MAPAAFGGTLAIAHVNVVDPDAAKLGRDQTVIISGQRIGAIGPADKVAVPRTAERIDGKGLYLVPGIDAHVNVHMPDGRSLHFEWHGERANGPCLGEPGLLSHAVALAHAARAAVKATLVTYRHLFDEAMQRFEKALNVDPGDSH